ncbi:uncharacterized protein Z518_00849 [Rhinocladiella mackenziei CBS 650.93]|uniref:CWH43-like N-terminal domain-containing protein n=1 Tax=Rhinocladiella mackenziei CBS 650.93 TaxID=1442369 RepID=A0A0D2HGF6_9EURO|nr:uncharacterized protein Z518_00849 [Rhinocladiella mackenziei CBS 650.93]KIX09768.1 hypothetical protein Z518_00849 [Rhinocladiella mackenziei CBS 650.93]
MSSFHTTSSAAANPNRSSFYLSESFAFLDDYTRDVVQPDVPASEFDHRFQRRKTTLETIQRRSRRKQRPWNPLVDYLSPRMNVVGALLPITSSFLETVLLLYLFTTYYSFPPDPETGAHPPRIAELYSTFPFISCVGSKRLPIYQGLTMCVVLLNITSTSVTFYRCRDEHIGWQTRRTGYLASVVAAGLSIWVVFAAANPDRHLHLLVTAVKGLAVFCIKATSCFMDHLQRRHYPALRKTGVFNFLLWWKGVTIFLAFPLAIMTDVAIFGCNDASKSEIQTPGTKCYQILALGAPAEWFYALMTVSWSLTIAFDIYTTPIVNKVKAQQDQAEMKLLSLTRRSSESPQSLEFKDPHARKSEAEDGDEDSDERVKTWKEIGLMKKRNGGYEHLDSDSWDANSTALAARGEREDKDTDEELDLGLAIRVRGVV